MSLVCTFLKEIEKILRNNQEKKKKEKKIPKEITSVHTSCQK